MDDSTQRDTSASAADADGVRVHRVHRSGGAWRRWIFPGFGIVAACGALALLTAAGQRGTDASRIDAARSITVARDGRGDVVAAQPESVASAVAPVRRPRLSPTTPAQVPAPDFTTPSTDPDDIASYFRPGDAEPTMTELIDALRESGVREGIAAFNPPGTSPLRSGLAVPPDFELPSGYVRHHQVTDQGVDVEPILMFAPDVQLLDEHGRAIAMPEDRIVPPELAPPGLPIRSVELPPEDGQ
jgi:hypothetical protein